MPETTQRGPSGLTPSQRAAVRMGVAAALVSEGPCDYCNDEVGTAKVAIRPTHVGRVTVTYLVLCPPCAGLAARDPKLRRVS
jgi:hypothetical protein